MSKNNRYCPIRGKYGRKAEIFFLDFAKNIFKEGSLAHHPDGKLNVDFRLSFPDNSFFQFEVERKAADSWTSKFPFKTVMFLHRRKIRKNCFQIVFNSKLSRFLVYSHDIVEKYKIKEFEGKESTFLAREISTKRCKEFSVSDVASFKEFVYNRINKVAPTNKKENIMPSKSNSLRSYGLPVKDYASNYLEPFNEIIRVSHPVSKTGSELIAIFGVVSFHVEKRTDLGNKIISDYPSIVAEHTKDGKTCNYNGAQSGDLYMREKFGIKCFKNYRNHYYAFARKERGQTSCKNAKKYVINSPLLSSELNPILEEAHRRFPGNFDEQVSFVETNIVSIMKSLKKGKRNGEELKNILNSFVNNSKEFEVKKEVKSYVQPQNFIGSGYKLTTLGGLTIDVPSVEAVAKLVKCLENHS
jgi:hypothetical protein